MFPSLSAFGGIRGLLGLVRPSPPQTRTLRQTILGAAIPPNPYQRHPDTCTVEYAALLRDPVSADELEPLAIPTGPRSTPLSTDCHVALVGGGIANIIAAYELSRVGIKVTLLEESARLGGRLYTVQVANQPAELGAMRFPDRGVFWHYVGLWAKHRGATLDNTLVKPFPNPSEYFPTLVSYQGETYPFEQLPPILIEANELFSDYLDGLNDGQPNGEAVYFRDVVNALQTNPETDHTSTARIESFWKAMIATYDGKSFGDILQTEVFANGSNTPNLLASFGTLGVGTGGFGPLYEVAMLEILRILLWEYQAEFSLPSVGDDPHLDAGLQAFAEGLADLALKTRQNFDPSASFDEVFRLNSQVTGVTLGSGGDVVISVTADGTPSDLLFDYAIVGMTTRAMQRLGIDLGKPDGIFNVKQSNAVLESARAAIRRGNLMSAFKMFLALPDPSTAPQWPRNAGGEPIRNFLTDGFPRASYVLPPAAGSTVTSALVSYAWGVDALKYEQMTHLPERQQAIADSYIYGTDTGTPNTSVFGKYILTGTEPANVVWNAEAGFGGGFKLDKPEDNYFTNSLFYHFQQAHSHVNPGAPGSKVFFAGDSVGHLGGWVEGAGMSAINAIVAVCSEVASATGEIALRDKSVGFLLDPQSNLFHKYVFVQGQQPQFTGLIEMHRLGSEDGIASAPPSRWSLAGQVQPPVESYLLSTAVSSDGNIVATVRNDGTVWVQERNESGDWNAAAMIDGLDGMEKVSIDSYERVNGPSQLVQLMAVARNGMIFHGIRTNGMWSSFQQPYPTERASECAIVLDGVNLQFVLKDRNAELRHGIRFPDHWSALGYPPGLSGASSFKVASIAIGCTSLAVDLTTVAVIGLEGAVYVGTRYGAQGGSWGPWQKLNAPEETDSPKASRVALVVQDDLNDAQLIATYGTVGPYGPTEIFSSARYAVAGPSVGNWTPLHKVPYPMGGKGREVGTIAISRLPRMNEPLVPPFSTMILADVYPSWSKDV